MEQLKIVVKVCYHGLLRFIICDKNCQYNDILKTAIELFNIPKEYTAALQMSNESGYIFEPKLFEYFLLLFPSPEIIFYLRLDYTKKTSTLKDERPYPFGYSKLNNKRQHYIEKIRRNGAPVRRQNCFIGTLPTTSSTLLDDEHIKCQIAKRKRYNDGKFASAKKVSRTNKSQRLIRL